MFSSPGLPAPITATVMGASLLVGITTTLILFCSHFHQVKTTEDRPLSSKNNRELHHLRQKQQNSAGNPAVSSFLTHSPLHPPP